MNKKGKTTPSSGNVYKKWSYIDGLYVITTEPEKKRQETTIFFWLDDVHHKCFEDENRMIDGTLVIFNIVQSKEMIQKERDFQTIESNLFRLYKITFSIISLCFLTRTK